MKRLSNKKTACIIAAITLLIAAGILGYLVYPAADRRDDFVTATVTRVIDRVNGAENGAYVIDVVDDKDKTFRIDADPYINIPTTIGEQRHCLPYTDTRLEDGQPRFKKGQKIEFNLPTDESGDFTSCFEKPSDDYFIRLKG